MVRRSLILFIICLLGFVCQSQVLYYQEICQCGVTGAGFSTGMGTGGGSGFFSIYLESGSSIKKAILFSTHFGDDLVPIAPAIIQINSDNILFDSLTKTEANFNTFGNYLGKNISVHAKDITNLIDPSINIYNITIPAQNNSCDQCQFNCFYLYVIYENSVFTNNVSTYVILNKTDEQFDVDYQLSNLNPLIPSNPIGFAIYSDRIGENNWGSRLFFNNGIYQNIGTIGGSDNVNSFYTGAGVKGHFYFQNNTLIGLDDDTPDNTVGGADGLIDVESYLHPDGSLKWRLQWGQNSAVGLYNIYNGFFVEHSTPCDAFSISVPSDTSICRGESLQLNVAGGSSYEWQPATNLSCSTCPNPVFTGDSTQLYTVRIWNNDSCSVVRPVKISVRNQPNFGNVNLTPSICGTNSGSIVANSLNGNVSPISFMVNNGVPRASGSFSNLSEGAHTITLIDGNGCMRDSVVAIGQVNNTLAQFSANPNSGAVPFSVSLSNSSVFADQFSWSLNGVNQGSAFTNFTATQTGTYLIELIAWQFDLACADTATLSITAFDSLIVQVPNIITPNDDHINDFFTLTTNLPLKGTVSILNRWGEVVYTYKGKFQQGETVLWDGKFGGKNITECTYFYGIELSEDPEFPLAIDKSQLPFKLEGFVEVRR